MLEACPSLSLGIALQALHVNAAFSEQYEHLCAPGPDSEVILIDVDIDVEFWEVRLEVKGGTQSWSFVKLREMRPDFGAGWMGNQRWTQEWQIRLDV